MRTFFDKYFFEIDSFLRKAFRRKNEASDEKVATELEAKLATERPWFRARSQRSDRVSVPLGRYVATELF